jgi:hypothetical protein
MTSRDEDLNKVKLAVLAREMIENMPAHIELAKAMAQITRAKYLALVAQGFDERQALELCK